MKKIKNPKLLGKLMISFGPLFIILQVIANKAVDVLSKKPRDLTGLDKVIKGFKFLLLGAEKKINVPSFMSFFGFIWLGLIGVLLITFGFRLINEDKIEAWVMLTVIGSSLFALSFLCLLFTESSSVFSITTGDTTRRIRIFQHFWHLFASLPILIAAYFAHKFFRKKHAVEFGEAKK